jgi:hypothetical protein
MSSESFFLPLPSNASEGRRRVRIDVLLSGAAPPPLTFDVRVEESSDGTNWASIDGPASADGEAESP